MMVFILGTFFGALVMFAARILDRDTTRIVDRYKVTGRLRKKKPVILEPQETFNEEELAKKLHKMAGTEYELPEA